MDSDAAYSICKTRLGISVWDFDDAWTTNGRIATTPPFGTTQSTGAICAASSWMPSSVSTPRRMGTRQDSQRTIDQGRIVAAYPQREHLAQRGCRRERIVDSFFDGPRSPAGLVDPLAKRHGSVLMPHHEPICGGRLVEECGTKGKRSGTQDFASQLDHLRLHGYGRNW